MTNLSLAGDCLVAAKERKGMKMKDSTNISRESSRILEETEARHQRILELIERIEARLEEVR